MTGRLSMPVSVSFLIRLLAIHSHHMIHPVVQEAPFLHVSFVDHDGLPQCIPMIGALQVDEKTDEVFVYLHGKLLR